MPFQNIASTSASTDCFSPSAQNTALPFEDLDYLLALQKDGNDNFHLLGDAWKGDLLELKHHMVVGILGSDGGQQWHIAYSHFSGSGCLVLPCKLTALPGGHTFLELSEEISKPHVVATSSLDTPAVLYKWRSWAWEVQHVPALRGATPGLRAFVESGPKAAKAIASEVGRWTFSKIHLAAFCTAFGVVLPAAASLFDSVLALITKCLPDLDEDALMASVRRRLGNERNQLSFAEKMFKIDEAVEFLDQYDRKLVTDEKKSARAKESAHNEMKRQFGERVKHNRERQAAAAAKAAPKPKAGAKANAKAAPKPMFVFSISHAQAKARILAGCSIWRGLTRQQRWGHCPPNRRFSISWDSEGGERQAMIACIRRLWREHLDLNALGNEACPWADLL